MILFDSAQQCCGCTACMAVCPTGAISMETDAEGFYYPKINSQKCVNCGKCRSVCSFQNGYNKNTVLDAYAIKHKDEKIRLSSRSGAAFILISDAVLEQGGAVYGAAFDDDFSVSHRRADTKTPLPHPLLHPNRLLLDYLMPTPTPPRQSVRHSYDIFAKSHQNA